MAQYIEDNENELDLMELIHVITSNIIAILLVGLILGSAGYFGTKVLIDKVYESSAKMIVNTRYDSNATVTNDQINSAKSLVDTYAIIVRSRTVLEPVMKALDIEQEYDDFVNSVTVSSVDGTQVMNITVQNTDPQLAHDIVVQIANTAPTIIMDTVEAGSVKTIEYPVVASEHVSPSASMNAIILAMLGMIIVIAIVLLQFILDNRFKNTSDIEKHLDLPILGIIPDLLCCYELEKGVIK